MWQYLLRGGGLLSICCVFCHARTVTGKETFFLFSRLRAGLEALLEISILYLLSDDHTYIRAADEKPSSRRGTTA